MHLRPSIFDDFLNLLLPGSKVPNIPSASDIGLWEMLINRSEFNVDSMHLIEVVLSKNKFDIELEERANILRGLMKEKVIVDFIRLNLLLIMEVYFSDLAVRSAMRLTTRPPFPGGFRVDSDEDNLRHLTNQVKVKGKMYRTVNE